jgi:uncharacterized integral membrane protein
MVRFLKYLIATPLTILFLIFAYANRSFVTVSFDPFSSGDIPAFQLDAPLFLVIILAIMIGVVLGGVTVWFAEGRHRKAERALRADAQRLRSELDAVKAAAPKPLSLSRSA